MIAEVTADDVILYLLSVLLPLSLALLHLAGFLLLPLLLLSLTHYGKRQNNNDSSITSYFIVIVGVGKIDLDQDVDVCVHALNTHISSPAHHRPIGD